MDDDPVSSAAGLLRRAGSVVALTGDGISTEAGIPDFRGPDGLWTRNPAAQRLSTFSHYLGDAEVRRAAWRSRLDAPVWSARPTAGHTALVHFERRGALHTLVTQNTDGLNQAAGSSPGRVVEIHGSAHFTECWSCKEQQPTLAVLERVRAGDDVVIVNGGGSALDFLAAAVARGRIGEVLPAGEGGGRGRLGRTG